MKKQTKKYAAIGAITIIAVLVVTMSFSGVLEGLFGGGGDFITAKFFDKNGKPIQNSLVPFTLIKSSSGEKLAEGAASMQFTLKAKNSGETPLIASLYQLTPAQLDSAFTKTAKTINPGEEAVWISSLIPTAQFENGSKTFYAKVKGTYTYAGQTQDLFKEGSVSYQFYSDPVAGMDVTFGSSLGTVEFGGTTGGTTGDGGTGPVLTTSGTSCTADSECQSGVCTCSAFSMVRIGTYNEGNRFCCMSANCVSCSASLSPYIWDDTCGKLGYGSSGIVYMSSETWITCCSNIKVCT